MKKTHRAMRVDQKEIPGTVLFGTLFVAVALMINFQPSSADDQLRRQASSESANVSNSDSNETKLVGVEDNSGNQVQ